ncbi:GlsB/YeaQ/YmgE family stress response membrane protein [bacterium]|nr:MAG: GlsB/YeaQ/YmgE family stress response membrane protein [bacterium]
MLNLILAILFGALVGFLANKLMGKSDSFWMTSLLGIVGSVVGNTLYTFLTTKELNLSFSTSFNVLNLLIAVLGAVLFTVVYTKFASK